ncbi:MAG TPA: DUF441 domain-containing protein [Bacillus bacterium]|uniref:UPF0756 membrane protein J1TS3_32230 n=1 Tax=Siminovitchia fordii TaxID=254759 RepID=A0ABQ4K8M8_9BACI|nr:DUF441 domain-containing protein [Siminovitchia fordii]GIN22089.1 UPF0756 membrane protein YtwI [Siminovitchia fordii]HBZ11351.1 DUF441 domain-containing protein [Bacillus sp. (in: firmicutes)]
MFNQAFFFLILLLGIGVVAKNPSLVIAVAVLIILKLVGADEKLFGMIQAKGINWGVTVITIAVLAPIASGHIGFTELGGAIKSPYAWIALGAGIAVAIIAKYGVTLLSEDPHITTALVLGTIMAVSLFKGVAVGPLIGAGIAYIAMKFFELFRSGSGMGG